MFGIIVFLIAVLIAWVAISTILGKRQYRQHGDALGARHRVTWRDGGFPTEVTSKNFCPHCDGPNGVHSLECPRRIAEMMMQPRHTEEWLSRRTALPLEDDSGEPMPAAMSAPPNIGGEDNPQYQGPHHDSVHGTESRFVPYDMLRDPEPGQAVHKVGKVACVGPLPQENKHGDNSDPD